MGNDWILAKTVVGVEEIATRTRRVPPRLRTMLILVDGRRSVAELIDAAAGLGDVRQALETLHDEGFVIRVGGPRPVAAVASRASAQMDARSRPAPVPERPANAPRQRRSLALARLYLLNAMEQSLRNGDQPVRDHLRNATSRAQLVLAFEMCQEIAGELGVRHIDTIGKNFYEMLPDEG
ncbi:MAG: hypothetical protein L6Q69_16685 [Zoogloea sp.]|nr:hypothetical protein [Zoogloea sp.]